MSELPLVEIDASEGEGGGQIIRTALSLSAITKTPVRIFNIRAKRPNPGLQAQHLMACRAVRNICRGTLEGAELKSSELIFHPASEIVGGNYDFDVGTAGSVVLVAQTVIPLLLFAGKKSTIRIKGGTHVMKSPSYDYFAEVFVPAAAKMGVVISTRILRTGFYPAGGGEIEITVEPTRLHVVAGMGMGLGLSMDMGMGMGMSMDVVAGAEWPMSGAAEFKKVLIRTSSSLPESISIREKKVFVQNGIENVRTLSEQTSSPGNAILLWDGFCGSYALGERGKRAEAIALEALDEFNKEILSKSGVDKHLADQLLLYAALASPSGENVETRFKTSEITEHLRTNAGIIKKFIKNQEIEINEEKKEVIVRSRPAGA